MSIPAPPDTTISQTRGTPVEGFDALTVRWHATTELPPLLEFANLSAGGQAKNNHRLEASGRSALEPPSPELKQPPTPQPTQAAESRTPAGQRVERPTSIELLMRDIKETPLLCRSQEQELARRIQQGDCAAKEALIKANLLLVVKIARKFEGRGLPLLDLISEGNIGLVRAAELFKPGFKGTHPGKVNVIAKFSTYSAWWIKQSIKLALDNQSRTIRLPSQVCDTLGKVDKLKTKLIAETGCEPEMEELAEGVGMKVQRLRNIMNANCFASLDDPSPLGDGVFRDIIPDEKAELPGSELIRRDDLPAFQALLGRLEPREQEILSLRFGLNEESKPLTLEEVGKKYRISRERIRQLQNIALKKLKVLLKKSNEPVTVQPSPEE